jgi:hypothetical protein
MFALTLTGLAVAAAVLLVAWFAAGTIWNVRLGSEVMRWMQAGLPVIGERTSVRWLGSSVVELVINEGKAPLGRTAVVIFMEPRDLPWWPLSRMQGRRDTLIVRGVLRRTPAAELEVLDPASWSGRDALPRAPREWPVRKLGGLKLLGEEKRAEALLKRAQAAGLSIRRLSVRRTEPGFQLHVALPDRSRSSREFFEAVHDLSELALK